MDDRKKPKEKANRKRDVLLGRGKCKLTQNDELRDAAKDSNPKALTIETMNPNIIRMGSAVLVNMATEVEVELETGKAKPFSEVIKANIGDCHAMGQVPLSYFRQVLSSIMYPKLLDDPQFPGDVKTRARTILRACEGGSIGSYADESGIEQIRTHVAQYIEKRDGGISSDPQNIVLASGATECITNILKLFSCPKDGKNAGIMVPIPQYPLYSASVLELGMHVIGYYLDESKNWELDIEELERARTEGEVESYPRALVVINPGNPTGQLLSEDNMTKIIKFARKYNLFLFADEVYQDNIYSERLQFHSFKKILTEMGKPYSDLELASFMSCSKGYMGECGLRGGYVEIINMDPEVKMMYLKSFCPMCPTIIGQACLDLVVCPPKKGDESYDLFMEEKNKILESLKLRAKTVNHAFNAMEGISCNEIQGAMYVFPKLTLPEKAVQEARKKGKEPDICYVTELLESTGVCVVPGSTFGQKPGTFHFRMTILPQLEKLEYMLDKLSIFHVDYMKRYA